MKRAMKPKSNECDKGGLRLGRAMAAALLSGGLLAGSAAMAAPLAQARQVVAANDAAARVTQKKVDALDDQSAKLLDEYRATLRQTRQLQAYVAQVQPLLEKQAARIATLQKQLQGQHGMSQQILPLLMQMANSLGKFVQEDLPFLPRERAARVANLKAALADPSLSLADKFQRLAQAYQVEAQYGRKLGHAARDIVVGGQHKAVDVLRVGRVVLLYETPDGSDTGYWNAAQAKWVSLQGQYARDIREGLRIARGDLAATPLPLPIPVPAAPAAEQGS